MMDSKQHSRAEDEVLVRVEGVSKKFCRSLKRSLWYGLCDIAGELSPFGRNPQPGSREAEDGDLRDGEFYAVRDVSFQLRRGECLGLIGHNGAGKTTLLKILNGLIKPDRGRIEMNGRVGALIALGAGFNPILTGRENIYINGSVLGLSKKEIDAKIAEIIDFAEIQDFIDMPVQNYSSGMHVRLGFSVAVHLIKPDILILDEILSVGDAAFRIKCLMKVRELLCSSAAIFVSHNTAQIYHICDCVLWLDHGVKRSEGSTSEVLSAYTAASFTANEESEVCNFTTNNIRVTKPQCSELIEVGDDFNFSFALSIKPGVCATSVALAIKNEHDEIVAVSRVFHKLQALSKNHKLTVEGTLVNLRLKPGRYSITLNLEADNAKTTLFWASRFYHFCVKGSLSAFAAYQPSGRLRTL